MDIEKKIKTRIYTGVLYLIVGAAMIVTYAVKSGNEFLCSFGGALVLMGIVQILKHKRLLKNGYALEKRRIAETDERNIMLSHKAKSLAFSLYIFLSCCAVIAFEFFNMEEKAIPLSYSVCALLVLYLICYCILNKKY